MPANIIVEGAVMRLTAAAIWGWGTSTPSTPSFANYIDIEFTSGSGDKVVAVNKNAVLWSDIASVLSSHTDSYHASGSPGAAGGVYLNVPPLSVGLDGTLLGVTIASQPTSAKWFSGATALIRDDSTGSFIATMTVPAVFPGPPIPPPTGTPIPDLVPVRPGTWEWVDHGQGSVVLIDND